MHYTWTRVMSEKKPTWCLHHTGESDSRYLAIVTKDQDVFYWRLRGKPVSQVASSLQQCQARVHDTLQISDKDVGNSLVGTTTLAR